MKVSKYLNRFSNLNEAVTANPGNIQLIGDCLLVEKINLEERKTTSGIILNATKVTSHKDMTTEDAPQFVHILMVGEGYYDDETEQSVPLNAKAGDIAMIARLGVRWFSDLEIADYQPYEIGLSRESEIKMLFRGPEAYAKVIEILNSGTKEKVLSEESPRD